MLTKCSDVCRWTYRSVMPKPIGSSANRRRTPAAEAPLIMCRQRPASRVIAF